MEAINKISVETLFDLLLQKKEEERKPEFA